MIVDGPILDVKDVAALEKRLEAEGTPLLELMRRAGHRVASWIRETIEPPQAVVILCGTGNNGGDGWVIAGYLRDWGYSVSLVTLCPAGQLVAEPARTVALEVASALSTHVSPSEEELVGLVERSAVIVDAILGTGFNGSAIKEPYSLWIRSINAAKAANSNLKVVAVDVPSGLSAQSGIAASPTVQADATITMLAYKPGMLLESSAKYCGTIILARIHQKPH